MNNDTLGHDQMRERLIKARKERGMTQVGLSRLLGRGDKFVWRYEHREHNIKHIEYLQICRALGIDPAMAVKDGVGSYSPEQSIPLQPTHPGTALAQRLEIRPYMRLYSINAPAHYKDLLQPLPEGAKFVPRVTRSTGQVHIFVTEQWKLHKALKSVCCKLGPDAALWISWPKRSARYSEINAKVALEAAEPFGLIEDAVCAIDSVWSAIKLVSAQKFDGTSL